MLQENRNEECNNDIKLQENSVMECNHEIEMIMLMNSQIIIPVKKIIIIATIFKLIINGLPRDIGTMIKKIYHHKTTLHICIMKKMLSAKMMEILQEIQAKKAKQHSNIFINTNKEHP